MRSIQISENRSIGQGHPAYIIAEIGINHNGSLDIAKQLIDEAAAAGCDAVKFQKRTPELCTPKDQWDIMRDTPWGRMSYINYRHKVEFGYNEYTAIDKHCKEKGIDWFVSCWDEESVDFIEQFNPSLYKFASASLTDHALIEKVVLLNKPYILSTDAAWSLPHIALSSVKCLSTKLAPIATAATEVARPVSWPE